MADNDDLLDYEDEEQTETTIAETTEAPKKAVKGTYVSIHSSGFRDFLLKPEILRAIVDCGFEHPSEVQHECIPQAVLGMDILCQAKSGMGKTAVFVLATLQQLEPTENQTYVLVMCHTRELAFQISKEYERFSKYMPAIKVEVFFGGLAIQKDEEKLKSTTPHIVVGTPGRILALIRNKKLNLKHLKHFILDECDKMLEQLDMRRDVQEIFRNTPHGKQVMMFSATLSKEIRPVCKKFMQDPMEVYVDDEAKLTLHGLQQHYVKLKENEKNKKLFELLDVLEFNQVVIFVKSVQRCVALASLLTEQNFPAIGIHRGMTQEERLERYSQFKDFQKRILVATNLFGRGMDIERVNIVFNYDLYILLCGYPPFYGDSDRQILESVKKGKFAFDGEEWEGVSKDAKDLIVKMIAAPNKRLTAAQVLEHPWMKSGVQNTKAKLSINLGQLRNFINASKLQKAVLTCMASQLSEHEIMDLRKVFLALDKNGDGTITVDELKDGLSKLPDFKATEIQQIMNSIDTDKSGKIDYTEFLAATMETNLYLKEEKLFMAFKMFDKDGNGKISAQELKEVLGNAELYSDKDEKAWDDLIKDADLNGDGEIDYNEFLTMMTKVSKK